VNNRVTHFEFYSKDPAASVEFFENALGWSFERWGDQPYWLANTGNAEGGINGAVSSLPDPSLDPHTLNTIDVEDLDVAIESCEAAGGTKTSDVMDIPGVGRWVQIREPGGNLFGMMGPASQ
jgi:predicted enzyme related to lactoylglutathione lyase